MRLSNKHLRRGLSFVEFMGCMVAMIGGVVLGSMYLGIDVQRMAVAMLEQAQVVAPGYFDTNQTEAGVQEFEEALMPNTAAPAGEDGKVALKASNDEATSDSRETTENAAPRRPEPTAQERRAATRKYWDNLTECMLYEAQARIRGEGSPEEWQLYDYLLQRKKGHEEALEKLDALDGFGVDQRLLTHGEQVIAWHQSGVKLFEHVLSLLSDGPNAKLSGPFAQSWQSAATQLRMEENLVIDRHNAIANYLDREYSDDAPFKPAFAK